MVYARRTFDAPLDTICAAANHARFSTPAQKPRLRRQNVIAGKDTAGLPSGAPVLPAPRCRYAQHAQRTRVASANKRPTPRNKTYDQHTPTPSRSRHKINQTRSRAARINRAFA